LTKKRNRTKRTLFYNLARRPVMALIWGGILLLILSVLSSGLAIWGIGLVVLGIVLYLLGFD
jgi:hypothetical protein